MIKGLTTAARNIIAFLLRRSRKETNEAGSIFRYTLMPHVITAPTETIMQLEDGVTIQVTMAVAASNVMTFLLNPWRSSGVPRVIFAANAYGWTQTRGTAKRHACPDCGAEHEVKGGG